ncbi:cysteine-rich motor neuron 1 protein [Orussus abietinus]|uniref:cysteine-rich motor neuron 1 protein n=1 Tax=Orussus abietinus TaxID=222816 RepID=UPI000C715BA6|nr:cysteine-rich motor neuron 1 protein [Orussus abietinus]
MAVDIDTIVGYVGVGGSTCPEDSVALEEGGCKCMSVCPPNKCRPGQRPVEIRPAIPDTPGSCCPLYNCTSLDPISWADIEEDRGTGTCIDNLGLPRSAEEVWQDGPCVNCVCEDGNVSCQATMCKSCENPEPILPGECCPRCPYPHNETAVSRRCPSMRGCEKRCDIGYIRDENDCPTCNCVKKTSDSSNEGKICPDLPHCGLNCGLVNDEGGCPVCACQDSTPKDVVSITEQDRDQMVCPKLKCDLHCERGLLMDENDCTLCECKPHQGCAPLNNCRKKCTYGYKTNKRGCRICRCRAACIDHLNQTHLEGTSWKPNFCTTCSCDSIGRLSCKETVCSLACTDPLPPKEGTCCPTCPIVVPGESDGAHQSSRGWGTVPITVIAVLALLCALLIVHIVRNRFRGRLSPSEATYASYPPQYYKYVPAYETSVHQHEKIVPL